LTYQIKQSQQRLTQDGYMKTVTLQLTSYRRNGIATPAPFSQTVFTSWRLFQKFPQSSNWR